jgi:hypothetical protein
MVGVLSFGVGTADNTSVGVKNNRAKAVDKMNLIMVWSPDLERG